MSFSFLKNLPFRLIAYLRYIQKPNPIDPIFPRILIVSTTALGDTLWAIPAIEVIKKAYPQSYLCTLTSSIGSQILQNNPYLDEIFVLPKLFSKKIFSFRSFLQKKRFQMAFLFHTSQRYALPFCSLLGINRIIGTENLNKGLDFLLTTKLKQKKQHETQRRLDMLPYSGLDKLSIKHPNNQTYFYLTSKEKKWGEELLPKAKYLIGIHPGAKDGFKCWPSYHFAHIIYQLKKSLPCEIILTGTLNEKSRLDEIQKQISQKIFRFDNLSLRKFASLISKFDLLVTNDTGPMHLASALKRPLIAIFSPTDPYICGPKLNEKTTIFYKEKTCNPCLKRKCNQPFCLLQTGPEEVFKEALKQIHLLKKEGKK